MMNALGWTLLLFICAHFIIEWFADYLNLKNIQTEIPKGFEDVYDSAEYERSQVYLKEKTKFGWLSGSVNTLAFITFWLIGGFNWINNWIESFGWSFLINGLIFFGILSFLSGLLSLPFSLYNTFVIEQRFGFNKMTWKVWIADFFKSLGLSAILGIPILLGVLWILEQLGEWAWLYAFGVVQLFTLLIQFIAPTWIMPLFNKFTPLDEGSLKQKITEFAKKVDFDLKNIFVIDGSKRSTKSNAYFTGFGKNKRIALYDTLIEKHTESELLVILAHEIGHYKHKHIIKFTVFSVVQSFLIFALLGIFLREPMLYDAFLMNKQPIYAGLLFFSFMLSPINTVLSFVLNVFSRKHEFEADAFAVTKTNDKESMMNALKKLSRDNLSNLNPHPFYVKWHYSHPPLTQRVAAIQQISINN